MALISTRRWSGVRWAALPARACISVQRILVERNVFPRFLETFLGREGVRYAMEEMTEREVVIMNVR
jgi:hypothetical protein